MSAGSVNPTVEALRLDPEDEAWAIEESEAAILIHARQSGSCWRLPLVREVIERGLPRGAWVRLIQAELCWTGEGRRVRRRDLVTAGSTTLASSAYSVEATPALLKAWLREAAWHAARDRTRSFREWQVNMVGSGRRR